MPKPTLLPTEAPSLVIIAHGSRRAAANAEIKQLAERVAAQAGDRYARVTHGFLEMAEPSIPIAIQSCIAAGAQTVLVVPYFLSAGRHVTNDIPQQVQLKQAQYPEVDIQIMPYIGAAAEIPKLLLSQIAGQTA